MASKARDGGKGPCIICLEYGGDIQRLYPTGLATVRQRAEDKGDNDVLRRISDCSNLEIEFIHRDCRRGFNDKRVTDPVRDSGPAGKNLRSSLPQFEWKTRCFICCDLAENDPRHPDRNPVTEVQSLDFKDNVLKLCEELTASGKFSSGEISLRVSGCIDMVAAEARHHRRCYQELLNKAQAQAAEPAGH